MPRLRSLARESHYDVIIEYHGILQYTNLHYVRKVSFEDVSGDKKPLCVLKQVIHCVVCQAWAVGEEGGREGGREEGVVEGVKKEGVGGGRGGGGGRGKGRRRGKYK